jgi:chromosome segregation ATPase
VRLISNENTIAMNLNNDLRGEVAKVREELEKERLKTAEMEDMDKEIEEQEQTLAQLQAKLKEKERIVNEYNEKFDRFEEELQSQKQKLESAEAQALQLTGQLEKQQGEMDVIRKENEKLALEKASEFQAFAQDRLDWKKATAILERNISRLMKEKLDLENRLVQEKERWTKAAKKTVHKDVQTIISGDEQFAKASHSDAQQLERTQAKLALKEDELRKVQSYAGSLLQELNQTKDKHAGLQGRYDKLGKLLEDKDKQLVQLSEEKKALALENDTLKKKREGAKGEIGRLNQQLARPSSRPPRGKEGAGAPRTASEAVAQVY